MSDGNQFSLLGKRRFGPFFLTQFLVAFNDNIFRNALIIVIVFQSAGISAGDTNALINLSAALFVLPFFLFSSTAGQLADKYDKAHVIRWVKALEILLMLLAAWGLNTDNVPLLIGLLFLLGTQSALFGPVKFGILPHHLREDELVGGNGMVETGTFLAILMGTMTGGILIGLGSDGVTIVSVTMVVIACVGFIASLSIPRAPPTAPHLQVNWNPVSETLRIFNFMRSNRTVLLSVLGISWFWFFGMLYLTQLPNYTKLTLGGNEQVVTMLLTFFSLGIGVGSLLCERMSSHRVDLGLVPLGAIGMTLFGVELFFAAPDGVNLRTELTGAAGLLREPGSWRVVVDVVLIGLFSGFYIVPLYALIQQRSEPGHRARIIAGNNILNAIFMVASTGTAIVLLSGGVTIAQLFLVTAVLNLLVAICIFSLVPEFPLRFVVWVLVHTAYRAPKADLDRIPSQGPVVLVCNHAGLFDALVIAGCCWRPTRFVVDQSRLAMPLAGFVFRAVDAIPFALAPEDPHMADSAFERIASALDAGEVVCIFPQALVAGDREIGPSCPAVERIVQRNPVPVVPIALSGVWRGMFRDDVGSRSRRFLRRLWPRIALVVGEPLAPEQVTAHTLRDGVEALHGGWE